MVFWFTRASTQLNSFEKCVVAPKRIWTFKNVSVYLYFCLSIFLSVCLSICHLFERNNTFFSNNTTNVLVNILTLSLQMPLVLIFISCAFKFTHFYVSCPKVSKNFTVVHVFFSGTGTQKCHRNHGQNKA